MRSLTVNTAIPAEQLFKDHHLSRRVKEQLVQELAIKLYDELVLPSPNVSHGTSTDPAYGYGKFMHYSLSIDFEQIDTAAPKRA